MTKEEVLEKYKQINSDKVNKETFGLIYRFHVAGMENIELAYTIADELVANRRALFSLDGHIERLMSRINQLNTEVRKDG